MLAVWQSDRYGVNWMQLVNVFVVRLLLHQFLYSTDYTLYSTPHYIGQLSLQQSITIGLISCQHSLLYDYNVEDHSACFSALYFILYGWKCTYFLS